MEDQVTITVDGMKMQVPKGTLLWEACQAHGIDIPIFCYHTKLGAVGACRTCLVEVEGMTKGPITACSTPVTDGMVVRTRSPVVEKAQRGIFEFLLANHPLDCPICDRAGECPLQDQTFAYGPGTSRYIEPKRHHEKPVVLGATIALDRERCVLCWRCVRFCSEIAEDNSIVLLDRGDHTIVGTFQDEPYVSAFSGNVVELCPVGALTSRKQRFNFRPWELSNRPSICPHCPMGCNINVSVRKNDEVIRFLSRDNPEVDSSWLCDRGRYGFEFINSSQRLTSPLIRDGEAFVQASWGQAFDVIAGKLDTIVRRGQDREPERVIGIASPRLTNEDLFVFKRFMMDVIGTQCIDHYPRPQTPLTSAAWEAMRRLRERVLPIAGLDGAKTILLLGADPSLREPVMELRIRLAVNRHGAKLVVLNPHEIPLSSKAGLQVRYRRERLADVARQLESVLQGSPAEPGLDTGATPESIAELVGTYLHEGPVALLYDDTFDGVEDKGDALEAIASLADALSGTLEVGVIPMLDDCNSMGARDLDIVPGTSGGGTWERPAVQDLLTPGSRVRAAFILGSDLAADPDLPGMTEALSRLDLLVVNELFMTQTARLADVVLPAASFAEKIGTFTNTEGRVQKLSRTVPSPGIARADWDILVDLSQYFDNPLRYSGPQEIWQDIREAVPQYRDAAYDEMGTRGVIPSLLQPV